MKNKSLLIASVFAASSVFAQDLTSKKGEPYLPEAGDWAISFDATPFLNYFGQMLSNAGATSPMAGYANGAPWAIRGKYFQDEKTAYRAGIRLGFGNQKWTNDIAQPLSSTSTPPAYPTPAPTVEDEKTSSYNAINLQGGLEWRRGKTRLQGYYGAELLIGFGGTKDAYTYGNALSTGTPDPTITVAESTDWSVVMPGTPSNITTDPTGTTARITERKTSNMMVGLRGFIGAEYFIIPKISVGAEFGWGLGFMSTKTTTAMESNAIPAGGTGYVVGTFEEETKTSGFRIDSDIQNNATMLTGASGSLNIIFHF